MACDQLCVEAHGLGRYAQSGCVVGCVVELAERAEIGLLGLVTTHSLAQAEDRADDVECLCLADHVRPDSFEDTREPSEIGPLTAPVTLHLATCSTLIAGLRLLGWMWSPDAHSDATTGLYAWSFGKGSEHLPVLHRPVGYIGIGNGKGGVQDRVARETGWVSEAAAHLHGRAMHRLAGSAVGGPVRGVPEPDLSWLDTLIPDAAGQVREWLIAPAPALLKKAESVAIRLAGYVGDTAPPSTPSSQVHGFVGRATTGRRGQPHGSSPERQPALRT